MDRIAATVGNPEHSTHGIPDVRHRRPDARKVVHGRLPVDDHSWDGLRVPLGRNALGRTGWTTFTVINRVDTRRGHASIGRIAAGQRDEAIGVLAVAAAVTEQQHAICTRGNPCSQRNIAYVTSVLVHSTRP
jgi:hypothetical protein